MNESWKFTIYDIRFARRFSNRKSSIVNSSGVAQHERDFGFADDFAIHGADPLGLADLSADPGQLQLDDQHIARDDRLAPFYLLGGHEIGDLVCRLDAFK